MADASFDRLCVDIEHSVIDNTLAQKQVLPSKIAPVGTRFVNPAKTFYSDLSVDSPLAFRFQHVWNESTAKLDSSYFTIFVAYL